MAEYQLFAKSDTKCEHPLSLAVVDVDLAQKFGEPVYEEQFSNAYQSAIAWMFVGFMRANTWDDGKARRKALKIAAEEYGLGEASQYERIESLLRYFGARYTMKAWRK